MDIYIYMDPFFGVYRPIVIFRVDSDLKSPLSPKKNRPSEAIACSDLAYAGDDPQLQDAGGVWIGTCFHEASSRWRRGGGATSHDLGTICELSITIGFLADNFVDLPNIHPKYVP